MNFVRQRFSQLSLQLLRAVALLLTLSACEQDMSDLESYVADVNARKFSAIEPAPEIKPYLGYVYEPNGRRNPFADPLAERETEQLVEKRDNTPVTIEPPRSSGEKPDLQRPKTELERMPLDSFRIVGLVDWNKRRWALVRSSEPYVYRVKVGDYLGRNFGLITEITDSDLTVRELLGDGFGNWNVRMTKIVVAQ